MGQPLLEARPAAPPRICSRVDNAYRKHYVRGMLRLWLGLTTVVALGHPRAERQDCVRSLGSLVGSVRDTG